MNLLQSNKFKCSVSSVLNKDTKQHGKQFLYDQQCDTAWSSDEGIPQWIVIEFEETQTIKSFSFQFQGGFVAKKTKAIINDMYHEDSLKTFFAEDVNSVQSFNLPREESNVKKIKFLFESSTDFFGRIILYSLQIF